MKMKWQVGVVPILAQQFCKCGRRIWYRYRHHSDGSQERPKSFQRLDGIRDMLQHVVRGDHVKTLIPILFKEVVEAPFKHGNVLLARDFSAERAGLNALDLCAEFAANS